MRDVGYEYDMYSPIKLKDILPNRRYQIAKISEVFETALINVNILNGLDMFSINDRRSIVIQRYRL